MRILIKMLLVTGLLVGIGNYMIYLKTGRMPVREWVQNWSWPELPSLDAGQLVEDAKRLGGEAAGEKPVPTKVYKWTDANGVVHYGERPAEGAQELSINPDQNILPSDQPSLADDLPEQAAPSEAPLDQARSAAEAMKARAESQQAY